MLLKDLSQNSGPIDLFVLILKKYPESFMIDDDWSKNVGEDRFYGSIFRLGN